MPASTFTFNGEEYDFSPETDIGISELRHIKSWYSDLGDYQAFTTGIMLGDPDAVACLIWIAQRKAGEKRVREPLNFPDFSVGEVMGSFVTDEGTPAIQKVPAMHMMLNGTEYEFDLERDLTYKTLKQIKRWYPEIGTLVRFTLGMFRGNPDALACVAWIVWGGPNDKSVPTPNAIDLAAGALIDSFDYEEPLEPELPDPPELLQVRIGDEVKAVDPPLPSDGKNSSAATQKIYGDSILTSDSVSESPRPKPKAVRSSNTSVGSTG